MTQYTPEDFKKLILFRLAAALCASDCPTGQRFASERQRLGIRSGGELARQLGSISQAAISKIELGQAMPSGGTLTAFAKFGADVHFILTGERRPAAEVVIEAATAAFAFAQEKQGGC